MGRHAKTFTQADVSRTVKGALNGGLAVGRVEIDKDGRIVLIAGRAAAKPNDPAAAFDEWEAKHADKA